MAYYFCDISGIYNSTKTLYYYSMIKLFLLLQTYIQHLGKSFISEERIEEVLCDGKTFNRFIGLDYEKVKARLTSPFYTVIFLIVSFTFLSIILFFLNLIYVGITILQPSFNHYLNSIIDEASQAHASLTILKVCLFFGGFKLCFAVVSVLHDAVMQFLGVRMYCLMASTIIKYCEGNTRENGNLIAIIEQDCQRFINVPFTIITILLKNLQFFFFIGYLISLINHYKIQVLSVYAAYFIISLLISIKCAKLNLKIMNNKQNRLSFADKTVEEIRSERDMEIKNNITLMGLNGVTAYLPDFINTIVMIFIYSIGDIDKDSKYTVLIVFGLLRSTVYGIGSAFNILAQIGTNAKRIIRQINTDLDTISTHFQIVAEQNPEEQAQKAELHTISKKNIINYSKIIAKLLKLAPLFLPFATIFLILSFFTYYAYGYAAQSITTGGSALQPINFLILSAQFLIPATFYTILCYGNIKLSRMIYDTILKCPEKIHSLTPEQLNRLSGDAKLVDRSLGIYVHNNFTGICRVLSSILYSIFFLNNVFLCLLFVGIFLLMLYGFGTLFKKTMVIRRNMYRREVLAKGLLLANLRKTQDSSSNLKKIYNFEQFGYLLESTFIFTIYFVVVLIVTILIGTLLFASTNDESIPILIMLLMQLDSNFISVCVYWIKYQIALTSTERCIVMLEKFQEEPIGTTNQSLLTQNLNK